VTVASGKHNGEQFNIDVDVKVPDDRLELGSVLPTNTRWLEVSIDNELTMLTRDWSELPINDTRDWSELLLDAAGREMSAAA
jgi:hypothetical protein